MSICDIPAIVRNALPLAATPQNIQSDSGSHLNILNLDYYNQIQPKPNLQKSNITLEAYGGFKIKPIGTYLYSKM